MFSLSAVCRLLLVLFVLVGPGCQLLPGNSSRRLAERFVQALRAESDERVDAYMAADAEVFLHGAPTSVSGARFQEYIDVLKRGRRRFQPASRIFLTTTGAGWLLSIADTTDQAFANPPEPGIPAQLWMEASIRDNQITRLWIHFTVDALPRMNIKPEDYRRAAASRGTPVPDGWSTGTPALLATAERTDGLADGGWTDTGRLLLVLGVSVFAVTVSLLAATLRSRRRPQQIGRRTPGALIENLRKAHLPTDG